MKEFDDIDQLFQTTFDGFELTPDASVKEHIDRVITSKMKRRRRFLFLFFLGSIISISGSVFYFISPSDRTSFASENKTTLPGNEFVRTDNKETALNSDHPHFSAENTVQRIKSGQDSEKEKTPSPAMGEHVEKHTNTAILNRPVNRETFDSTQTETGIFNENNFIALEDTISGTKESNDEDSRKDKSSEDSLMNHDVNPAVIANIQHPDVPSVNNWYLIALFGWEGERTKPFEDLDGSVLSNENKEFARIRSSSFYGKVEVNRKLAVGFDVFTGLGFRSSKVTQYGSLYVKDSVLVISDITSTIPETYEYFVKKQEREQEFRVNAIILPVGLASSFAVGRRLNLRLSVGTEFSYGWLRNRQLQPGFSKPEFRSFGCNIWLRPEVHYSFGRLRLIGFGTFNHALSQQLKWDVTTRRNLLFGGGIGMQIRM